MQGGNVQGQEAEEGGQWSAPQGRGVEGVRGVPLAPLPSLTLGPPPAEPEARPRPESLST